MINSICVPLSGDYKPCCAGVIGFQQAIGAFDSFKSGFAEQIADRRRVVDVFLELQVILFADTDTPSFASMISLSRRRVNHRCYFPSIIPPVQ
jgi:hypothetical protein